MRKLLFALLFIISFSSVGLAQVIDAELQKAMNKKSDEMISINIILKSQMDLKKLNKRAEGINDKYVRRDMLIDELKLFAEKEQAEILSILKAEEKSNRVSKISSSWSANYINCVTTSDVIYLLAEHPDVMMIGLDEEKYVFWNEESTKAVASPGDKIIENVIKVNAYDASGNLTYSYIGFCSDWSTLIVQEVGAPDLIIDVYTKAKNNETELVLNDNLGSSWERDAVFSCMKITDDSWTKS